MIPGSAVLADILVFLREREADRNLALPGVKSAAEELLELGDVVSIGRLGAYQRTVEPCLAVAGIELDDPVVVALRRIELAEESPYRRAVVENARIGRRAPCGLFVRGTGARKILELGAEIAHQGPRRGAARAAGRGKPASGVQKAPIGAPAGARSATRRADSTAASISGQRLAALSALARR